VGFYDGCMQKMTLEKLAEMMQGEFLTLREYMEREELRRDIKWIKSRLCFIEDRISRMVERQNRKPGFPPARLREALRRSKARK